MGPITHFIFPVSCDSLVLQGLRFEWGAGVLHLVLSLSRPKYTYCIYAFYLIFCSIRPLVAAGEKPKLLFFLTEFMSFKLEYNSNLDNIL